MPAYNLSVQGRDNAIEAVRSTLFNDGPSNAVLAPLTTTAGLIAAFAAVARHGSMTTDHAIRGQKDIEIAVADGILDNTMVAAGNTMALLIASIDAKHSAPTSLPSRPANSHFNS